MKKIGVILIIISLFSCDLLTRPEPVDQNGRTTISLNLATIQSLGIDPTVVRVTLTHQVEGTVVSRDLAIDSENNTATGTISNLQIGTWDISAVIYSGSTVIGTGTGSVTIQANVTTQATIEIALSTGDAEIIVNWEVETLIDPNTWYSLALPNRSAKSLYEGEMGSGLCSIAARSSWEAGPSTT